MITLNFSVDDQLLTRTDENTVAANSHLVHTCEFVFSSEWNGRGKVATFKKRDLMLSVIVDDATNSCVIPPEILQSDNKIDVFEVSVCGANGNSTITSTIVKVPILAGTWDPFTEEITPTLFEQIMQKIDEIEKGEISPELVLEAVTEYMEAHPLDPIIADDVAAYFEEHKSEFKGDKGATPAITATAEVNNAVGTPSVTVTKTGTAEAPNLNFAFQNLKGAKGDTGVTPTINAAATVDNTTGTPAVNVSKTGTDAAPEFTFAFSGLKGEAGDSLTYDDLTAAQKHEIIGGAFVQKTRNILETSQLLNNTAIQLWGNPTISNYTYESQGKTATIPIDCSEGDVFKAATANSGQVNFGYITFNENGAKVRTRDAINNNITIEAGETKIAFYFPSRVPAAIMSLSNIYEYPIYEPSGNKPKYQEIGYTSNYRPCDYIGDEITMLNKVLFIGDSFVEGLFEYKVDGTTMYMKSDDFNLPSNLSRMTGLEITNKGDGGTTCATWYSRHVNDDLSGHKACFIALGINDTLKQTNGWNNDSDTAMTQIVQKVRNENGENIPIFIATIPAGYYYASGTFDATNARIRSIANTLDAYIVDLGADNNIIYNFHLYGGHPNSYGYHEIAKEWRAWISYIIATRDSKFRDLQFVGTEYSYN